MTHTMRVLDQTGDTLVAEWTDEDTKALHKAAEKFAEVQASGRLMFGVEKETGDVRHMESFTPEVDDIIAAAPVVGG